MDARRKSEPSPNADGLKVILATDGSQAATAGVELVAHAAWPAGTTVRVVEAIDALGRMVTGPFGVPVAAADDSPDRLEAAAAATLERACHLVDAPSRNVERSVLNGRAATAIVAAAQEAAADLVVLGSRGHGTIETMVLGSVSAEVVDHSPTPVLVARGERLDRVVLAWDGSECAGRAAELLRWPIFARSSIAVVGVAQPESPWWAGMSGIGGTSVAPMFADAAAESRREHQQLASAMASELTDAGLQATPELRSGDPAQEIIAAARAIHADLVVLGTHGRTGIARILLGSVARNVLQHAPCSVLISR